jgi:hypothetical protein
MRQTIIIAATTALVSAIVATWGTTVIIAQMQKEPGAATASTSIDVMGMMSAAKDLPEEKYDAH